MGYCLDTGLDQDRRLALRQMRGEGMRLAAIILIVLLWPPRAFRFMAGLTMQMFCPGRDEPEARAGVRSRRGRAGRGRVSFGGGDGRSRRRYLHHRIRKAGKK